MPVRVSAISFLNPAPLLYNFEHEPAATELRNRYTVHYTTPANCAAELHAGQAELGLIPVAQLTGDLSVVPGCTIASQNEVRSILLLVRHRAGMPVADALRSIQQIAADRASRSSAAYVQTLLRRFHGTSPHMDEHAANPLAMLAERDAALLIGDPALIAREQRKQIDASIRQSTGDDLLWVDLAQLWRAYTGLPWVAAVWAVRPEGLAQAGLSPEQVSGDLQTSRDAGLAHVEQLVDEWVPRLPLPAEVIRTYLTRNIYYILDAACLEAIRTFRAWAAEAGVLPPLSGFSLL